MAPRRRDKSERLTAQFGMQISPSDKAHIKEQARTLGLSSADYVRRRLFDMRLPRGRDPQAVRELLLAIQRYSDAIEKLQRSLDGMAASSHLAEAVRAWRQELEAAFPERIRKEVITKVIGG